MQGLAEHRALRAATRSSIAAIALCAFLLLSSSLVEAQDPYTLRCVEQGTGSNAIGGVAGQTFDLQVDLVANQGDIAGWSYGVCFGADLETVAGSLITGADAQSLNGGTGPGFQSLEIVTGGVVHGAVTSFNLSEILNVGTFELSTFQATIANTAAPGAMTALTFCETLAIPPSPPVELSISTTFGTGEFPVLQDLPVDVINANQFFFQDSAGIPGGQLSCPFEISNTVEFEALIAAAQYDPTFLSLASITPDATVGFFASQQGLPSGDLVFELIVDTGMTGDTLPVVGPGNFLPVATLLFDIDPLATPGVSTIGFVDGIGSPVVNNEFQFGGGQIASPGQNSGDLRIADLNSFERGECNNDGALNIADGIFIVNALFGGGPPPLCDDACDANDDGGIDLTDALYMWNYLLLSGPQPPAPFGAPGLDPTFGEGLGCDGDSDDV